MSLKDLLSLAPVPGLDAAVTLLTASYTNIQKISVYRKQCEDMADRCVSLMLSVREGSKELEGSRALALADQLEPVLERINKKVREWAEWGPLKCFLQQGELKDGIDMLQRQLDNAILKFGVAMKLELQRSLVRSERVQEATRSEFRQALQAIMDNQTEFRKLLAISSPQPVEQVMRHLQTELQDPDIPQEQNESFRKGLWELHSKTAKLPPLTDLTGQVELQDRHPAFIGTYNDVYIGIWLDKEKVAVRLPRTLLDSTVVHEKFQLEVSMWRTFDHPNVLPLYGVVYIGKHLYSVSPWMSNGTALSFVKTHPQANRLKMLSEIAEGLAYLHSKNIVHGDLRGDNVLISDSGVARLSDFGLSKFLEDCNKGLTSASSVNPRYFAPEILQEKPLSKESDIWSLGMTFLELLTGDKPFNDIMRDINVLKEIDKGKIPTRPTDPGSIAAGLDDNVWNLLKRCWKKAEARPTIREVQDALALIRGGGSPTSPDGPKRRLSSLITIGKNTRKNSTNGSRPGTATSVSSGESSNSSGSVNIKSLRGLSIHSIQENHWEDRDTLTPLTPSPLLGSSPSSSYSSPLAIPPRGTQSNPSPIRLSPSSYTSPLATSPPRGVIQPNRRPSQASDTQNLTRSLTLESRPSVNSHFIPEGLSRERSSAPRLELFHLENPSGGRVPARSYASGPEPYQATPRSILTVDTMNQDPLLQQALNDPDDIVYTSTSTGEVVAGTLTGLIERVVNNFNLRKDEEYREVILTACIDFSTPEELFSILRWRFDEAEQDTRRHHADRVATQYNVFMVLMYWLSSRKLSVDSHLLSQMREFCETTVRMKVSTTMTDRAVDLLQLIDKRARQDALLRSPPAPGRRISTADEVNPRGLAIALTLLEGDKFKQIMPCDYLAHQCNRPGYNNVDVAREVNEKIILWIKQSLLHFDGLQQRAMVLKFFINAAQECRKLRNYQSLIAIAIALSSTPVQNLELTRNFLNARMVAQLEALVKLPDPEDNHRRYREALQEAPDPAYQGFCIPWLAVHLKELHSVLHLNKTVVQINGRPLINFERYTKFLEKLKSVFPLPPPDLEQHREDGQLAYLEGKLAGIQLDADADDRLYQRSEVVRMNERVLAQRRVTERMRLGFKVSQTTRANVTGQR